MSFSPWRLGGIQAYSVLVTIEFMVALTRNIDFENLVLAPMSSQRIDHKFKSASCLGEFLQEHFNSFHLIQIYEHEVFRQ